MPRHHNKHVCSKTDILCEEEIQSRKHQTTLHPAWQFQPDTLFVHICAHQPIAMLLLSYCCVLRECVLQHFTDSKRAAVVLWRYDQLPAHSHEKLTAKGLNIHNILTHILHSSLPWETHCCRVTSKNVNIDSLHTHMPQTTLFTNLQTSKFLKYKMLIIFSGCHRNLWSWAGFESHVCRRMCSTQCVHSNHVVCVIVCSMHMQSVQCRDIQMGGIQFAVQVAKIDFTLR